MDDLELWLKTFDAEMAEKVRQIEEVEKSVKQMRATAASPDNSVLVTVGPAGAIDKLELTKRACDLGPSKLSALILTLMHRALREMNSKVAAATEQLGPEATGAFDVIMEYLPPQLKPGYVEDEAAPDNVSPLWRGAADDEDDEGADRRRPAAKKTGSPAKPVRARAAASENDDVTERPW